jgi:K+-sensing histidine kinase KdpD
MTFGIVPALVASVFSAVIYNLWILPPLWKFSVPTAGEIVYLMIKVVVASISIPFALRKISERKRSVA